MKLYKRLIGVRPEERVPDDLILTKIDLPSPTELLRVSRLRYLKTLFSAGKVVSWGLFNVDQGWCRLIEDDLTWMHQQLRNSSSLQDPKQHLAQWLDIIQYHPGFWKRLTTRAMKHAAGQRAKLCKVVQTHNELFELMRNHDFSVPTPLRRREPDMRLGTDGLIPPLQAEGPLDEARRRSDFSLVLEELYEDLALIILHSTELRRLEDSLRERITREPLSWTRCLATLCELYNNLEHDAQDL
ncbi:unnamed protein product, partial [Cladocopium goreaui]